MSALFHAITLVAAAWLISLAPAAYGASVAGSYQTVTESEWGIELSLNPDGSALIEIASWLPGESEKAKIEKHRGAWSTEGANVVVNVPHGKIVFEYVPRLSFASFGRKGSAPGLRGLTSTLEPNLFVKRRLWLTKELKKLKWEVTD